MVSQGKFSAGLLLYRRTAEGPEFFLAHPGGPFWRNREEGAWTIPKGVVEPDEDPFAAAIREFHEETGLTARGPYVDLGMIRQRAGKVVQAWGFEGDADPLVVRSTFSRMEWPRGSDRWITYPEIDRCVWAGEEAARKLLNAAQVEFIDRLMKALEGDGAGLG